MDPKFDRYLIDVVGIGVSFRRRIETIYEEMVKLCPEEVKMIFISEYLLSGGDKALESFWLFSDRFALEGKNFLTEYDFDITTIKNCIAHAGLKTNQKPLGTGIYDSLATLTFRCTHGAMGEMKASVENCISLYNIYETFIKPNLV